MEQKNLKHYIKTLTANRRTCLLLLVFFVLFSAADRLFSLFNTLAYISTALTLVVSVIITSGLYIYITRPHIPHFFRINKIKSSDAFLWFFLGICANCAITIINIPLNKLFSSFMSLPQVVEAPKSFGEYVLGILCIAIVPAIFEELFCRAIVLREYERYGSRFAIVASALAFLILHNSLASSLSMLILGLILAFIVTCTDSIFPAMIFHFSINFFSLTINYISESIIPPHIQPEFALMLNIVFMMLALVFLLNIAAVLPDGLRKINAKKRAKISRFGFSFSLIIIILIYISTQLKYFI